jgi:hypothetical protein
MHIHVHMPLYLWIPLKDVLPGTLPLMIIKDGVLLIIP